MNNEILLPDAFEIRALNISHLDEIYNFVNNNYEDNLDCEFRPVFCKEYLYWYLKKIEPGFAIGLVYKTKLVGLITAIFIEMSIWGIDMKVPEINFLCISIKLRKLGLAKYLINHIENEIINSKSKTAIYVSNCELNITSSKLFCEIDTYTIPINHAKLISVDFLSKKKKKHKIKINDPNPLHLMQIDDVGIIAEKLNTYLSDFKVRTVFNEETVRDFFIPKKDIVYSFVKKINGEITDFVSIYKSGTYVKKHQKIVSTANLTYYFCETLTMTELIKFLILKLESYKFDQFSFNSMGDNEDINLNKFATETKYVYSWNPAIPDTKAEDLMINYF